MNKHKRIEVVVGVPLATTAPSGNVNYLRGVGHRSLKRKMWKKESHKLDTGDKRVVLVYVIRGISLCK